MPSVWPPYLIFDHWHPLDIQLEVYLPPALILMPWWVLQRTLGNSLNSGSHKARSKKLVQDRNCTSSHTNFLHSGQGYCEQVINCWGTSMPYSENKLTRQATITARLVPPNESCNILVSLLSRYGTRESFALRALITFDKAKSDWLIAVLSSKRKPSFPVLRLFSLPAVSFQRMKNDGNLKIQKPWGSEFKRWTL